ncbi:MAG: transketolase C-terminal domain-containing protein [Candidatus Dormiibacterota bacterium]
MRSLTNVRILAPADEVEAAQAIRAMMAADGPFYLQVTREASPVLFDSDHRFQIGRGVRLCEGGDVSLVSTGPQTTRVFEASEILSRRGIQATVLHLPTIKPIDELALVEAARATGLVVVVEEQNVLGGLGGAVAEVLSKRHPVSVIRLGIRDAYGESGPNPALLDKHRLSASKIAEDVHALVTRRTPRTPWITRLSGLDKVG